VWNFDNILEDVHSIDRHEKPIEAITLASDAYLGATTTRNCVGIWYLESGRIIKTLANSAHSSIVTHSAITADGRYVVSAESGQVLFWDIDTEKVLKMDAQRDVQQLELTDHQSKVLVLSKVGVNKAKCVCRAVPTGETVYQFEYAVKKFKAAVVTSDGLFLVIPAMDKKNSDILSLYHAKTGTLMYDMTPKYSNYKEYSHLVAMPNEHNHIALIDSEKGNIWDVKKKSFVRSVAKWNGVCTSNGKYGLYAPNRGGMEMLELKTGKVVHTLIPKVAEGVHSTYTLFTKNDQHVIYYHSGRRSIRVFRVTDGRQIADYQTHAEIKAIASTEGGSCLVLGAVDGSVVVLTVADPIKNASREFLSALPSRQLAQANDLSTMKHNDGATNVDSTDQKMANGAQKFGTVVQVARLAAKAKMQKSRACVLS
jgi:WD40 repeat protein